MDKYRVTHKANEKQVWEVEEIEANWIQVDAAGDLSFGALVPVKDGIIAAGWWMCVERIVDAEPPIG